MTREYNGPPINTNYYGERNKNDGKKEQSYMAINALTQIVYGKPLPIYNYKDRDTDVSFPPNNVLPDDLNKEVDEDDGDRN
jgi:hypothetical protein